MCNCKNLCTCATTPPTGGYGGVPVKEAMTLQRRSVESQFCIDQDGNPKGGFTHGEGFSIDWQNGVQQRSGAFLEEIIEACIQRLSFFQSSKFACKENAAAIAHLKCALAEMESRLKDRVARGVEGSYEL